MADDRYLHQQQQHSHYLSIPVRIIHEYDFFADAAANKLKAVHILPLPENPEALREFFVPELKSPARVFRDQKETAKDRHQEIPDPMLIDTETSSRILVVDDDQETRSIKGKMGESSNQGDEGSFSFGTIINKEEKNRNLENPNGDHHRRKEPNPPPFHEKILGEIRDPPVFLFEKKLESPDLYSGPNRLLILNGEKVMGFLSEGERRKVEGGGFITVVTREARLACKEHKLQLAKLDGSHDLLLLKDEWWSVLADLRLKSEDLVQGWGYRRRRDDEFRLALNIIRSTPPSSTRNLMFGV